MSTSMMRQQSVPNRMTPAPPPPSQHQSLSPVPRRRRRLSGRSQPKPKPRLLVDYSTHKADLKGPGIRRTKSLDQQEKQKFQQRRYILRQNKDKAQSARQVVPVDWTKLSTELDWQPEGEEEQSSQAAVKRGSASRESLASNSCSDLLRQSFLNKPLGTSQSHLQQLQRESEILKAHSTVVIPLCHSRSRSTSPVRPSSVKKQVSCGNYKGPPPKNHLGLPPQEMDVLGTMMDDSSMRLGDVFGGGRRSPDLVLPDPKVPKGNVADFQREKRTETVASTWVDQGRSRPENKKSPVAKSESAEESDDQETQALIERLTQDTPPAPVSMGRLYRSMSASMNAALSPLERKLQQSSSKTKSSDAMSDVSSLTNETASLLSFPRKSAHSQRSSSHSPTASSSSRKKEMKKTSNHHHLGGNLGLKPWDDDFDNSVSSMSSHWESMDDDTYAEEQKKKTNNKPSDSKKPRHASSSLGGSALALNHLEDDTEAEKDDEDLLFLPQPTKKAAVKKTSTPPSTRNNHSTSSRQAAFQATFARKNSFEDSNISLTVSNGLLVVGGSSQNLLGGSSRRMNSSGTNLHNPKSGLRNTADRRRNSSDRNMKFNIRKTGSGQHEKSNKMNGSTNSLESFSGDEKDYLDENEKKSKLRKEIVRNHEEEGRKSKTPSPTAESRRQLMKKQLSCERLDSEYDRFKRKNILEKAQSTRSVSPRRNAALLVRADSVPRNLRESPRPVSPQQPVKMASSSKLMSSMPSLFQEERAEPISNTRNNKATNNNHMSEGIAAVRGRGLAKQGSRPGLLSNAASSPVRKKKTTIGKSKSFDEDSISARQSQGFRESMLLQASFVTGSRIRRLNKFSNSTNTQRSDFNSSFNMSGRDFSRSKKGGGDFHLHMSSPNLSFDF